LGKIKILHPQKHKPGPGSPTVMVESVPKVCLTYISTLFISKMLTPA